MKTHHSSRGSGNVRWTDIKSDAYWLKALFNHPESTARFISDDILVGNITGRPSSPGLSRFNSPGATSTPFARK